MSVIAYEKRLDADRCWALQEGSMHFERDNGVFKSLKRITDRLNEMQVPYAVVGGMALFLHGYRRFTEDVDILVTREALTRIHEELEGRGYVPPFAGSKNLRDADTGVRIEFLVAGGFPGDGKPKPITFPDPAGNSDNIDGITCLSLPRIVELKLASGMTNPARAKDIGDVVELIKTLGLTAELANALDLYVRGYYLSLLDAVQNDPYRPDLE